MEREKWGQFQGEQRAWLPAPMLRDLTIFTYNVVFVTALQNGLLYKDILFIKT